MIFTAAGARVQMGRHFDAAPFYGHRSVTTTVHTMGIRQHTIYSHLHRGLALLSQIKYRDTYYDQRVSVCV